ncbi:hypothetical protein JXM67_09845 [candidate division WOR-3 bacterium]|nr:hypothetical protein [candidate division WOR-3 bacterium]
MENYPWWWVLWENLLNFVIWALGVWLLWPLGAGGIPIAAIGYIIVIIVFIWILLKKHNCTTCYYYDKWCHLGWGKYAALFFKKNSGNPKTGARLAVIWMILPLIPLSGAVPVMLWKGFSWMTLIVLIVFLALNIFQFAILRKRGCRRCKRRFDCAGSAAK